MKDYHILSLDSINGKVTDHSVGLDIKNIPWAGSCGPPTPLLKTALISCTSR